MVVKKNEEERKMKMKKYAWLLAMLLALPLAFFGCGGGDDNGGKIDNGGTGWTHDLGAFSLELGPNFQYGTGYQGLISSTAKASDLFNGERIRAGDVYKLEIEFTLSRDWDLTQDDDLEIGLTDRDESVGWWKNLLGDENDEVIKASDLTKGTSNVYSYSLTFTATETAGGTAVHRNDLFFQFESSREAHETNNAATNSTAAATAGIVTMNFTKFIFSKESSGDPGTDPEIPSDDGSTLDLECQGEDDKGDSIIYQGIWAPDWLFQGEKITEGDQFTFSAKVKLSRAVDYLVFGFLDSSEEANWWTPLTEWEDDEPGAQGIYDEVIAANVEKEILIQFTTKATSTANGPSTNSLFVMVKVDADECDACHFWSCGMPHPGGWTPDPCPCETTFNDGSCTCNCVNEDIVITFIDPKVLLENGDKPIDGDNIIFSLTEFLTANSGGPTWNTRPLQANSSVTYTVENGGINVTGRTADHEGLDIWIDNSENALNLDTTANIYEVRVSGTIIGTPPADNSQMALQGPNDPWPTIRASGYLAQTENVAFTITGTLGEDFLPAQNRVRIQTQNANAMSFRITSIEIENKGAR